MDTNHGSNSWMMLSKRMTANNLDENPANHANASTVNTIKLLAPEGFSNFEEFDIAAGELVVAAIIQYDQLILDSTSQDGKHFLTNENQFYNRLTNELLTNRWPERKLASDWPTKSDLQLTEMFCKISKTTYVKCV